MKASLYLNYLLEMIVYIIFFSNKFNLNPINFQTVKVEMNDIKIMKKEFLSKHQKILINNLFDLFFEFSL